MTAVAERISVSGLAGKKRDGEKIVAVVAWDHHMARIADRVGVDIVSVGDTVGMNLWGRSHPFDMSMDEMVLVSRAVRGGVTRALVSADFPFGPLQEGTSAAVRAAIRLVKEAAVDLVKLDGASDYPEAVTEIARAGIPVWAQFGVTPQRALRFGQDYATMAATNAQLPPDLTEDLVREAKQLEQAGASLLDFTNSGPVVGAAVARSVTIPVLGGFGGGPWLDGRVRMAHAAIGYAAPGIDAPPDTYANVAQVAFDALNELVSDVRGGRQIRGGVPVPPRP
jgi:3-methyl-2-oxobutanoate hydroxymethyltransferase